jgi:hypothetical protein
MLSNFFFFVIDKGGKQKSEQARPKPTEVAHISSAPLWGKPVPYPHVLEKSAILARAKRSSLFSLFVSDK